MMIMLAYAMIVLLLFFLVIEMAEQRYGDALISAVLIAFNVGAIIWDRM